MDDQTRSESDHEDWDQDVAPVVAASRNSPPLHQLGVARVRELLESIPRPAGPDMRAVVDSRVPGPYGHIPIRVYRPHSAPDECSPALVWFHGGGMIMGSLKSFDRLARELASATGAVLVNVGYRLAPEHPYPVANDEAYTVVEWLHQQHQQWSVDPGRIGVGGDSAGGGLAAATTLRARSASGPPLAQQILVYPGVERRQNRPSMRQFGSSPFLTAEDIDWMKALYLGDDPAKDDEYGVPATATDLADLPPAIVACGFNDPLRDGIEDYGRRLQDAGVMTALLRYPGVGHGFLMQTAAFGRARQALAEIGALAATRFR